MAMPHRPQNARRRRVPRWLVAALALTALALVVLAGLRFVPGSPLLANSSPTWNPPKPEGDTKIPQPRDGSTQPNDPLPLKPAKVKIDAEGSWGWALLDLRTGELSGQNMSKTSSTASMIKAWIAADFLRRAAANGTKPSKLRMQQLTFMIRDSDNNAAQALWSVVGKANSTKRMIDICELTDSSTSSNWSLTMMTPRDVARLGACISDGRAAGKKWTKWLLNEMRLVRGTGDFGIRKAFPAGTAKKIAIKNGWVIRDEDNNNWHVNCLAIGKGWAMGIMTSYATELDYTHGAKICEDITRQLRR
jgi:hypothetical protein